LLAITAIVCLQAHFSAQYSFSSVATYSATRMQLLNGLTDYLPKTIADDGRVGGYVRRSGTQSPYDLAVVWDLMGVPDALPMGAPFDHAYVNGFTREGTPIGHAAFGDFYPAGFWDTTGFVSLPISGGAGLAAAGAGNTIVGFTYDELGRRATIWNTTGMHQLPNLTGTTCQVNSINELGIYVGGTGDLGGFIGQNGSATRLNYPGFATSFAFEINDENWITGVWFPQPGQLIRRGFIARAFSDEIHDLGVFPGYVESYIGGINNENTIVGAARNSGDYEKALIWLNGSLTPQDLNLMVDMPGVTLIRAIDVNNAGQVLVEARLDGGGHAYYRLDPIPEPAAMFIAVGASAAITRRRDRTERS
jgi:hypothetical protein